MAKSAVVSIPRNTIVQLTDDTATVATWQVRKGRVGITVTASETPPTTLDDAIVYVEGQGEVGMAVANLNPGISGTRIYAEAMNTDSEVYIAHD